MTNKKQPEALRLAEMLTADEWPGSVTLVSYAQECVAELLTQHARITELESQLAQRFDAADIATAAAQGFRDGVAKDQQAMWRHIETAPKDGQAILVTDDMDCYCVEWDEEFDWWTVDDNKLGPFRLRGSAPTHWMPLPAAPALLMERAMSDMQCPYCGADQEVCHDDGAGYSVDERHEHTCSVCDKTFVFTTFISVSYTPRKADCLNDAPHELAMSKSYSRRYSRMQCVHCDYQRTPTSDEFAAAGINLEK